MRWLILLVALSACCPARQVRTQWDTRVGTYTYDQAVVELGPPTSVAEITTGKVAVWRWIGPTVARVQPGYGGYTTGYARTRTESLELVFDGSGVLQHYSWSRR